MVTEYWTGFILGFVGSLHCAGMCGPLALALPGTSSTFIAGRVLYNSGRLISYCGLGIVSGLLGRTLVLADIQRWVSIALGVLILAGLFGSRKLAVWNPVASVVQSLKAQFSTLLRRRSLLSLVALGILNGFLPCGLVYVAAAGAITTGGIVAGGEYMIAFGLGTVPMMLAIGLSGRLVPVRVRLQLQKAVPASIGLLATLLILRGLSLGIPFLSPDLSPGAAACCSH